MANGGIFIGLLLNRLIEILPTFEYYQDDLRPIYERNMTFLYDFNEDLCI